MLLYFNFTLSLTMLLYLSIILLFHWPCCCIFHVYVLIPFCDNVCSIWVKENLWVLVCLFVYISKGPSWSWSYGSWIYNYLCNQCLSPPTLWVRILHRWGVLDTTLCDIVCQWLATVRGFLWVLRFPPPKKNWPTRYNWNIVVSGTKHHKPNPQPLIYISIVVADHVIMKGRLGSHYINQFKPVTFLCLSQARTWISIGICHGLFLCSMIRGKDGCLFFWYWWNCWPSLFKLFFHKSLLLSLLQNKDDIMWKCIYILY
jgi:hypothetical protein